MLVLLMGMIIFYLRAYKTNKYTVGGMQISNITAGGTFGYRDFLNGLVDLLAN
jgi:hypothetical protein